MLDELEGFLLVDAQVGAAELGVERGGDDQHDEGEDQRRPADQVVVFGRHQADGSRAKSGQEGNQS